MCRCDLEHRFWKPCEVDAEVDSTGISEALRSRCFTFAGQCEPVQHRCRAPRPDGQLCTRQDRLKVGLGQAVHCGQGRAGLCSSLLAPGPSVGTALGHCTSVPASPPAWCWARGPWRWTERRAPSRPSSVLLHLGVPALWNMCWRAGGCGLALLRAVAGVSGSQACVRMALFSAQCPFHGKIIPRDDAGQPLHAEDRAREQRQQLQRPAGRPGMSGG